MKLKKRVITAAVLTAMLAMEIFGSVCAAEPAFDGGIVETQMTISNNETQNPAEISEEKAAGIAQGNVPEESADGEIPCEAEGAEIIYAGIDGDLSWSIDAYGHLLIEGEGNYENRSWREYSWSIKTAEANVTEITSTVFMFEGCSALSSVDLSGLDTGNVMNMRQMFAGCSALSSVDLSGFDTGKVTSMSYMFWRCESLSSVDVSGLDTGNVTDMGGMFSGCSGLSSVNLSGLDTGNVTSMNYMFEDCSALRSVDLSGFNIGKVRKMSGMFAGCSALSVMVLPANLRMPLKLPEIEDQHWEDEAGKVRTYAVADLETSMKYTKCEGNAEPEIETLHSGIDGDLSWSIDTRGHLVISGEGDYENMAWLVYSEDIKTAEVNVTRITSTAEMFSMCSVLTSVDLSGLDTGNLTDMSYMFEGCTALTSVDLSGLDLGKVTDMSRMFYECTDLVTMRFPANLKIAFNLPSDEDYHWENETGKVCTYAFAGLSTPMTYTKCEGNAEPERETVYSGTDGDLSWSIDTLGHLVIGGEGDYEVRDWSSNRAWLVYSEGIKSAEVNVTGITSTAYMFYGCTALTSLDLSGLHTENVTNMSSMFDACSALTSVDLTGFKTEKVTNMSRMFFRCLRLNSLDVSNFDTKNVTDMSSMFSGCRRLKNLDVSSFNTGKVTSMQGMFEDCTALTSVDLSRLDTGSVANVSMMFYGCTALTTMRFPANLKMAVKLPLGEDDYWMDEYYHWEDETGKVCAYAAAGLVTPMTYKKCEGEAELPENPDTPQPDTPDVPKPDTPQPENPDTPKPDTPDTPKPDTPDTPKPDSPQPDVQKPLEKGETVTDAKSGGKYVVTKSGDAPEVQYKGTSDKKKKTVTIPSKVTVDGVGYKVTAVAPKAFKGNKKVTTVKIPATVTSIGASAFENCSSLKSVTVPAKVKTIDKNAFKDCKKLKTIVIKSKNIKKVGKNALKGIPANATIKVPKAKLNAYKKLFKNKGLKKTVKIVS